MKRRRQTVIAILIAFLGGILLAVAALGIYDCVNNSNNNDNNHSSEIWTDAY